MRDERRALPRYGLACPTCALPVHEAMVACPWCTTRLEPSAQRRPRPATSLASECAECAQRVRPDWSSCPWCGVTFRWSLQTASEAIRGILADAGLRTLASRLRFRYSRTAVSYVWAGDDRKVHIVAARLRDDERTLGLFERLRRKLGREPWMASGHPLHVPLHEAGHVFEHFLDARDALDEDGASSCFGDLQSVYDVGRRTHAWARLRGAQPHFVSAYATAHPCEDFAETFAVVAFHRGKMSSLRRWAQYHSKGPGVVRKFEWMVDALARARTLR